MVVDIDVSDMYMYMAVTIHRARIQQSLQDAVPLVTQAIGSTLQLAISDLQTRQSQRGFEQDMDMGTDVGGRSVSVERQFQAAMRCFEAWVVILPARYALSPLISTFPPLIFHIQILYPAPHTDLPPLLLITHPNAAT